MAPETGTEFAVGGEAKFVTVLTEVQVRHRADESDVLVAFGDLVIGRRAVGLHVRAGNERTEMTLDDSARDACGEEVVLREHLTAAHGHEFDETQQAAALVSE